MTNKLTDLARSFVEIKARHEAKSEELKAINAEWQACEEQLLDAMVDEGVASTRIDGVGLISMRVENFLSVTAANKEQFYSYLQSSGNGGLLKLDVNPKTLTAFLKEHLATLVKQSVESGLDEVQSREKSLEYLKNVGANYFTKRTLSHRAK